MISFAAKRVISLWVCFFVSTDFGNSFDLRHVFSILFFIHGLAWIEFSGR